MSDQIREQVSAFLDGELPSSESELLLKRLTRDADLRAELRPVRVDRRDGAGREADASVSRGFAARVNRAIDGERPPPGLQPARRGHWRWWRPVAGAAVAAGVAAVAVVALQQRAVAPGCAQHTVRASRRARSLAQAKEALSYMVPAAAPAEVPAVVPAARLTSYVFAHSNYSSGLGQGNVMSGLLSDDQAPAYGTADRSRCRWRPRSRPHRPRRAIRRSLHEVVGSPPR